MFVFFLLTGRWLEARLRERTAGSLEALINRLPQSVHRQRADGEFDDVGLAMVKPGDVLQVRPGEVFAADGQLLSGHTWVEEALLSGESEPLERRPGEAVLAGSHNLRETVTMTVTALGESTRYAAIVNLMQTASLHKPRLAALADRIAKPFLLAVLVVWLFLRDWRATLVAAAALPLSVIPTFLGLKYFGYTLNTVTLLSLALVVGVLVDDAIVEIENIARHLAMGKTPKQAALLHFPPQDLTN